MWGFSELYNVVSHMGYYPWFGNLMLGTVEIFLVFPEICVVRWETMHGQVMSCCELQEYF